MTVPTTNINLATSESVLLHVSASLVDAPEQSEGDWLPALKVLPVHPSLVHCTAGKKKKKKFTAKPVTQHD